MRLTLEISHSNKKLYKTEFFESIIIPNILFEGNPSSAASEETQKVSNKKGGGAAAKASDKKEALNLEAQNLENFKEKENTPYSIICAVDASEAPFWLKSEEIEWSIRVFSSDSLAFVKDTSKEQFEKSLKDSWEVNEPGRALKAKTSRFKFILENKFTQNENLNKEEVKFLENFKQAEGNLSKIPLQQEEQNRLNGVLETNSTEDNQTNEKGIKVNSKNAGRDDKKGVAAAAKKKHELEAKNKKNNNKNNNKNAENLNNTKDHSLTQTQQNNILNTNESINLISIKDEINNNNINFNVNFANRNKNNLALSPINYMDSWNFFKSSTSKRFVIQDKDLFKSPQPQANFIKDFIGYVEEDRTKIIKNNMIEGSENYNRTSILNIFLIKFLNKIKNRVLQSISKLSVFYIFILFYNSHRNRKINIFL